MAIPPAIKGYWGIVQNAAAGRKGSGSLFAAINSERANNTLAPIKGIDAIQMGQIYSVAVQQRNATDAFSGLFNQIQSAEGDLVTALRNTAITGSLVSTTLKSASAEIRAIAPKYAVRYEYSYVTPTGETSTTFGYLRTVDLTSMTMGDVIDTIQTAITQNITTPTITSFPTGSTFTFTGRATLLSL